MFYKCYFAAVWNSLDVPAPDVCISAINPKMALRPMILPASFQLAWRHSQGVAELGYVLLPAPTWASRSIAVKMFIIHIFNSVQPFSVVVTASMIHGILACARSGGLSTAAESPIAQGVGVTIGEESGILARWLLLQLSEGLRQWLFSKV